LLEELSSRWHHTLCEGPGSPLTFSFHTKLKPTKSKETTIRKNKNKKNAHQHQIIEFYLAIRIKFVKVLKAKIK